MQQHVQASNKGNTTGIHYWLFGREYTNPISPSLIHESVAYVVMIDNIIRSLQMLDTHAMDKLLTLLMMRMIMISWAIKQRLLILVISVNPSIFFARFQTFIVWGAPCKVVWRGDRLSRIRFNVRLLTDKHMVRKVRLNLFYGYGLWFYGSTKIYCATAARVIKWMEKVHSDTVFFI